jgi:ATPase subunit of ABC transporter with duplicated ATPase domains
VGRNKGSHKHTQKRQSARIDKYHKRYNYLTKERRYKMETQLVTTEKKPFAFRGVEITIGKIAMPLRAMFYGENGAGKTSIFACAQKPILFDMEGNCGHIDKVEKTRIQSLAQFHSCLDDLIIQDHEFKSLILDSADSIQIYLNHLIEKSHTPEQLAYRRAGAVWTKHVTEIIDKLEYLNCKKRMNILITAQLKTKSANNPMTAQYDRYDIGLNDEMRKGFCNWVQCIALINKEVILEDKSAGFGKKKAKGIDRRVLHTKGAPTYFGKNVYDLPEKILVETPEKGWEEFTKHVKNFYSK